MSAPANTSIENIAATFDHYDKESAACPWERWRRMREEKPVAWSEKNGGFWVLSGYQDVVDALRDTTTFSNHLKGVTIPSKPVPLLPPSEFDGAQHTAYRQISNPLLSPDKVATFLPWIREIVHGYTDRLLKQDSFNVATDLAMLVTAETTARVLGIENAPPGLKAAAEDLVLMRGDPKAAGEALFGFVSAEVAKRKAHPGDDAITVLLNEHYDDTQGDSRPLSDDEVVRMTVLLIMAGLDTTTSAITGSVWYLVQNPDAQKTLREADDRLWRLALDELVRWVAPITGQARTLAHDAEFGGCPMRAGERIFLISASANRDPEQFEDPDEVILDRFPNRHVGFGMGPHRCVGSHLAKAVMQATLKALLDGGLEDFRLGNPDEILWEASNVRGIRSLPLVRK